jgi:hypothetical protein
MVIVVVNRGTAKAENFNTTSKYTLPSGVSNIMKLKHWNQENLQF